MLCRFTVEMTSIFEVRTAEKIKTIINMVFYMKHRNKPSGIDDKRRQIGEEGFKSIVGIYRIATVRVVRVFTFYLGYEERVWESAFSYCVSISMNTRIVRICEAR
jgi:hypothetical protein